MAVLSPQPHRIRTTSVKFNTTIVTYENMNEQRFCNSEESVTGMKCFWYGLPLAEQKQLKDFFVARKGAFEKFTIYNHHDRKYYTVRFKEDSLSFGHLNSEFADAECEVVQCL